MRAFGLALCRRYRRNAYCASNLQQEQESNATEQRRHRVVAISDSGDESGDELPATSAQVWQYRNSLQCLYIDRLTNPTSLCRARRRQNGTKHRMTRWSIQYVKAEVRRKVAACGNLFSLFETIAGRYGMHKEASSRRCGQGKRSISMRNQRGERIMRA